MSKLCAASWLLLWLLAQACGRPEDDPGDSDSTSGEEMIDEVDQPSDDTGNAELDRDDDIEETVDDEMDEDTPTVPAPPPPGDVDPVESEI